MEVQISTKVADSDIIESMQVPIALNPLLARLDTYTDADESLALTPRGVYGGIQEVWSTSTAGLKDLINTPFARGKQRLLGREIYTATFTDTLQDPAIAASIAFHTSFHRFKDLPGDIANKIWKYALPGPRTITVTTKRGMKHKKNQKKSSYCMEVGNNTLLIEFGKYSIPAAWLSSTSYASNFLKYNHVQSPHSTTSPRESML